MTSVHRRFSYGKCVDCGTDFVIDAEGGPACPKCDASDLAEALERRALEAPAVDVALRNTDRAPAQVFAGIVGRGVHVESVHVAGEQWGRVERGPVPSPREQQALAFCFRIALEHDHGGAKRLRRLLFAWHNAAELGGFDFADLWSLDDEYRGHAMAVINMIARSPQGWYAEHYGYSADMAAIVDTYGPGRAVHS
jgi:hypothetical protein